MSSKNTNKKTKVDNESNQSQKEESKQATQQSSKQPKKEVAKVPVKETKSSVKVKEVKEESDSDDDESDDSSDEELVEEDSDDDEQVAATEDDSDEEEEAVEKPKEKKNKDTYDELTKRSEEINTRKKLLHKKKVELETELKKVQRDTNECDRELSNINKEKDKRHVDDVNRARKEGKKKRTSNVSAGIMEPKPIPETLRKYLNMSEETRLTLPKLMSAMNNKFTETKQKQGQSAFLTKDTLKSLGLSTTDAPREIKFTEMMAFVASFYPKKVAKVEVEV
jgi:hypothetical protein